MKIQAWGWLTAGVLALGLNGFYQDGGFAWAHQLISRAEHNANAVIALASGHANDFLAEARILTVDRQTPSTDWTAELEQVQDRVAVIQARAQARANEGMARVEVMSARHQAEVARLQASREIMQAQIEARRNRWQAQFERANFKPIELRSSNCGVITVRVPHVRAPRIPRIDVPQVEIPKIQVPRMDVPQVQFELSAGPV